MFYIFLPINSPFLLSDLTVLHMIVQNNSFRLIVRIRVLGLRQNLFFFLKLKILSYADIVESPNLRQNGTNFFLGVYTDYS